MVYLKIINFILEVQAFGQKDHWKNEESKERKRKEGKGQKERNQKAYQRSSFLVTLNAVIILSAFYLLSFFQFKDTCVFVSQSKSLSLSGIFVRCPRRLLVKYYSNITTASWVDIKLFKLMLQVNIINNIYEMDMMIYWKFGPTMGNMRSWNILQMIYSSSFTWI